jgi:hypothetical protein
MLSIFQQDHMLLSHRFAETAPCLCCHVACAIKVETTSSQRSKHPAVDCTAPSIYDTQLCCQPRWHIDLGAPRVPSDEATLAANRLSCRV